MKKQPTDRRPKKKVKRRKGPKELNIPSYWIGDWPPTLGSQGGGGLANPSIANPNPTSPPARQKGDDMKKRPPKKAKRPKVSGPPAVTWNLDWPTTASTDTWVTAPPAPVPKRVTVAGSLRVKTYAVMERAVEEGVAYGYTRAHKHTSKPDPHALRAEISDAVMNAICEWFDFGAASE